MEPIPAIDLISGRCVRLRQGDFSQVTYYERDPLDIAKEYEAHGARRLHLVDLEGAKAGEPRNLGVLERIAASTKLSIDFGGGLSQRDSLCRALEAGATDLCIGTVAAVEPELFASWVEEFSPSRFVVAADLRGEEVAVKGWVAGSGKRIDDLLAGWLAQGLTRVLITDIARDGMMQGPATALYSSILDRFPTLQLWASGGVRSADDLESLRGCGCAAAVIGKALLEGAIPPGALKNSEA